MANSNAKTGNKANNKKANNKKTSKPSTYKVDVIANNKTFKNASRSPKHALKLLIVGIEGEANSKPMVRAMKAILKDEVKMEVLNKNVRRINKGVNKGKTCPFYVLQEVYKMKQVG